MLVCRTQRRGDSMYTMLSLVIGCVLCWQITATTYEDVNRLKQNLLQNYTKSTRPVKNQSERVKVLVTVRFRSITGFDIVEGVLRTQIIFAMSWTDEYMHWVPHEYGNASRVFLPYSDVWVPKLVLINPAEEYDLIKADRDILDVDYSSNGTASINFAASVHSTCEPFIKYFPFDTHTCSLMLFPLGYYPGDVVLLPMYVDNSYEKTNGQWEYSVSNLKVKSLGGFISYLNLDITLKRLPDFLFMNLCLPILFLIVINMFVFVLPAESGEKASFAITVLLSLAVFMTIVMDQLPPLSNEMPVVSLILCIHLGNNVAMCVASIFSINFYYRSETRKIPWNLRLLASLFTWRRYRNPNQVTDISVNTDHIPNTDLKGDTIGKESDASDDGISDQRPVLTWQIVSLAVDRWHLLFCIAVTSLEMFILFYYSLS